MAIEFDGTDEYVGLPDIGLGESQPFSITGRINTAVTKYQSVYAEGNAGSDTPLLSLGTKDDGDARFIYRDDASTTQELLSGLNVCDGAEHLIVCVSAAANNHKLYVDETEKDSGVVNIGATTLNTANIGKLQRIAASDFWDDFIIEVRIYNRALSLAEIKIIYNARGTDNIVDGLVGRWLMNEKPDGSTATVASSVIDISGNGNHGTPANSPVYRSALMKLTYSRFNDLFDIPRSLSINVHDCTDLEDIMVGG